VGSTENVAFITMPVAPPGTDAGEITSEYGLFGSAVAEVAAITSAIAHTGSPSHGKRLRNRCI
jgi:hypothetical protein